MYALIRYACKGGKEIKGQISFRLAAAKDSLQSTIHKWSPGHLTENRSQAHNLRQFKDR